MPREKIRIYIIVHKTFIRETYPTINIMSEALLMAYADLHNGIIEYIAVSSTFFTCK